MDYTLKFKKEKEDKGYWNTSVFADTDEEAIKKAERLKANGKYYSVILEKITYKYKTMSLKKSGVLKGADNIE